MYALPLVHVTQRQGRARAEQGKEQFPDAVHPVVPAAYYPIEKVHDIG